MLHKIKDFIDTKVYMVILIDDFEGLSSLTEAIVSIGLKRVSYELYKDDITAYMMELRMPYNRYLAMMRCLQDHGYNLSQESNVGIFSRLIKIGL